MLDCKIPRTKLLNKLGWQSIIESDTKNIPREFSRQLAANGITNTNLTDAERALIKRVYDIRLATPATPEVEPSAPSELTALEEGIPEKKETRVPEQMGFPGMGKPKGVAAAPATEAVEEVEAAPSPVLTGDLLDKTGLSKQSGYYKRLIDKDMSVPDQQTQVRDVLVDVRSNPNLATSTKQAIERVAMQAFNALAKQGALFGPKGGVITPAPKPKPKPEGKKDESKQTDNQTGRAGAPSGKPTKPSGDTEKSGTPKRDGVGAGAQPAGEAGVRKEADGDTLKKEEAKKEEPKKEEAKKEEPKKEEPKKEAPKKEEQKPASVIDITQTLESKEDAELEGYMTEGTNEYARSLITPEVNKKLQDTFKLAKAALLNKQRAENNLEEEIYFPSDYEDAKKFIDNLSEVYSGLQNGKLAYAEQVVPLLIKEAEVLSETLQQRVKDNLDLKREKKTERIKQSGLTVVPRTEAKKEEAKKEEPKKEEPKKEEPKTEAKKEAPKTEAKKADPKFGFYGDVAVNGVTPAGRGDDPLVGKNDAIDALAYDVYVATMTPDGNLLSSTKLNNMIVDLRAGKIPEGLNFGGPTTAIHPQSGGKFARAFFESLDEAGLKRFTNSLLNNFTDIENQIRTGAARFTARQEYERALVEQIQNPDAKRTGPTGPKATAPKLRPLAEHGVYKPPKMLGLRPGAMDFEGLPSGPVKPTPEELQRESALFYTPMDTAIVSRLKVNDLVGALELLGKSHLGRTSRIATVLSPLMQGVKVELVDDLKNSAGRPLAGSYDYTTNTIRLNADKYMSPHALLHEATHAAFSKVLSNKSHPAYKQLSDVYTTIKDSLDTAYGARSLEDFVSEAFSNPEFQAKLAAINVRGEKISAWKRFSNSVTNYLRTLLGLDTKGVGSALDATDRMLLDLLATDPQTRGVGVLYQASMLGSAQDAFKSFDNYILSIPAMNNRWVSAMYEVIRNKIPGVSDKLLLRSLPLNALTSVAVKDIPMAGELDTLEKQWNGAIGRRRREADATMTRIQRWLKTDKDK
jgi:hypothetical protein